MLKRKGFSLVEILISLFLSSIITTSIIQAYLSHKKQYQQIQTGLDKQFDMYWITELMRQSILRAGFTPCRPLNQLERIRNKEEYALNAISIQKTPYPGIITARMNEYFVRVIKIIDSKNIITSDEFLIEKSPVLIADCNSAEVKIIDHITKLDKKLLLQFKEPLTFHYQDYVYIGQLIIERWFIQLNAQREKSLYFQDRYRKEEISPEIKNFKAQLNKIKNKSLIDLNLHLKNNKSHHLIVGMRNN